MGHRYVEDNYDSDSDKVDEEDAQLDTDLEAIMASLRMLATLVAALQYQAGTSGQGG